MSESDGSLSFVEECPFTLFALFALLLELDKTDFTSPEDTQMNKSLVLATLVAAFALAACGKKAEVAAPAPAVAPAPVVAPAAAPMADAASAPMGAASAVTDAVKK